MGQLIESVVSVFEHVAWVAAEPFGHFDEVHGNQEGGQGQESKGPLPTDGLQSRHVVLGDELFLVHHLSGDNHLKVVKRESYKVPNMRRFIQALFLTAFLSEIQEKLPEPEFMDV